MTPLHRLKQQAGDRPTTAADNTPPLESSSTMAAAFPARRRMLAKSLLLLSSLAIAGCTAVAVGRQLHGDGDVGMEIARQYPLSDRVLAIELPIGDVEYAAQEPYDPQAGDYISDDGHDRWLERDGKTLGNWVSAAGLYDDWNDGDSSGLPAAVPAFIYGFDHYHPPAGHKRFRPGRSEQPRRYRLSSATDPAYADPLRPQQVFRKSKPVNMARVDRWNRVYPVAHQLYFQWPHPLQPGQEYRLESTDGSLEAFTFRYEPEQTVSEAIHISHIGFRPDEPKLAFLSSWMGSGGGLEYDPELTFRIIDQNTAQSVYQGQIQLRRSRHEAEDPRGLNYSGAPVYEMAFDDFAQAGDYRLCVETVGCSDSFPIAENPWRAAFKTAARGLYFQRSGIAWEPSLGDRSSSESVEGERPAPFVPQDVQLKRDLAKKQLAKNKPAQNEQQPSHLKVYQSKTSLSETGNGLADVDDNFAELLAGRTNQVVANAWGGYFDAADWDRRIQHLDAARLLLELTELFPDAAAHTSLNLPESGNGLPDMVNEALWGLEVFKRMQLPNGGIRGGIESAEHPRRGETSWQESWSVLAYAPDAWSSYVYAGVAARAALVLDGLSTHQAQALAKEYRASAEAAMGYGEQQPRMAGEHHAIQDARNLAALELWRLTQNEQWHDIFRQTTVFQNEGATSYEWDSHDQRHAAFLYAQLSESLAEESIQAHARQALLTEAQASLALSQSTGFAWTRMNPWRPTGWGGGMGNPKLTTLLRAHALTQDKKYLKTALRAGQFSVGANPLNMTFTTGVGHRYPQHPLVIDQRVLGQPPASGITVYGPLDLSFFSDEWSISEISPQVYPDIVSWPIAESYFDMYLFPASTEFTVHQTMAPLAYAWGYFAARDPSLSAESSLSDKIFDTK